ncbi:MAG: hypothetical protein IJ017_07105 [Oscillospiraceae bacterium]|nr:hypothetical protein [Oscillospiraceae bacterium]
MRISKEAVAMTGAEVTEKELAKINAFTGRELSADDVFVFSVKLCDNEIDRDGECFSAECLKTLAELFMGKTGISDHSWSSSRQVARIFDTEVIEDYAKSTSYGDVYTYIKARAYTLKTPANEEFIARIEGGINKEVSVGCAVSQCYCSICGNPLGDESCGHIRGLTYAGRKCYGILDGATDAYEWSFVAVPAQRDAGVIKGFYNADAATLSEFVEKCGKAEFTREFELLTKQAEAGRRYLSALKADVVRLGALTELWDAESLTETVKHMDESALLSLKKSLDKKADEILPPVTQLGAYKKNKVKPDDDYMI